VATVSRTPDEHLLIARARRGDERAFEALVARHAPYAYNLALRTLGDAREAEDVAQEAFVRAWRGLPGYRAGARMTTWLYTIVTRLCYDRLPRLRRDLDALDADAALELPDDAARPEPVLLDDEVRERLWAAIDALPASARLLVTLRHREELSYDEIAAVTGMPLGTVKVGLFRARQHLRAVLAGREGIHEQRS
jgi:RNA polymerase sigma-70 factor, ECF subfamily